MTRHGRANRYRAGHGPGRGRRRIRRLSRRRARGSGPALKLHATPRLEIQPGTKTTSVSPVADDQVPDVDPVGPDEPRVGEARYLAGD